MKGNELMICVWYYSVFQTKRIGIFMTKQQNYLGVYEHFFKYKALDDNNNKLIRLFLYTVIINQLID